MPSLIDPVIARRIKLVGFDVDGVLTDAGVYIGRVGGQTAEFKRFDIQDGVGIRLLRSAGLTVVFVSGRVSEATELRARELQVDELIQDDAAKKLPAFEGILARRRLTFAECAFAGDDLPDLPLLARVGLPIAVANAVAEVKAAAAWETTTRGGHGAVREIAEALLRAQGSWDAEVRRYLVERGEEGERVDAGAHATQPR